MKRIVAILLSLAMVVSLAACSGSAMSENKTTEAVTEAETTAAATEAATEATTEAEETEAETELALSDTTPLKIGLVCDLTGNEATTGELTQKSLEFAIKQLGDIGGKPVEVVVEDAGGDAAAAADKIRKMVEEDGVQVVFGPTQAGQKASAVSYCDEAGIPLIFANGTPVYLFNTSQWLIGAGGGNPQMTSVMADYCYNELGYRTVHILTMDNTGFRSFADDFKASFGALGGTVKEEYYAPFGSNDWSTYFAAMSTDGVDGIMAWTTGALAISLWSTYAEMGMDQKLPITAILSSAFTDYYVCKALETSGSSAAESIIGTVAPSSYCYDIDTPENKAFVEAWEKEFGEVPNMNLSGLVYDAYQIVVEAVKATDGDTSPEALRDAMLKVNFDGVTGHMCFEGTGAATRDTYVVEVVKMDDGSYNYGIVKCYDDVPGDGLK